MRVSVREMFIRWRVGLTTKPPRTQPVSTVVPIAPDLNFLPPSNAAQLRYTTESGEIPG